MSLTLTHCGRSITLGVPETPSLALKDAAVGQAVSLGVCDGSMTAQSAAAAARLIFHGATVASGEASAFTFPSIPLGPEDGSRIVIVAACAALATIADTGDPFGISVTVGSSPLELFEYFYNSEFQYALEFWVGHIPAGTAADVTVTWRGTTVNSEIAVWSAYRQAWPVGTDGLYSDPDFLHHDYAINTLTGGAIRYFKGGVSIFAAIGTQDYTGFDKTFEGYYISGGYSTPDADVIYHDFAASVPFPPEFYYYGGLAFGP